jgi:hypothetical protein
MRSSRRLNANVLDGTQNQHGDSDDRCKHSGHITDSFETRGHGGFVSSSDWELAHALLQEVSLELTGTPSIGGARRKKGNTDLLRTFWLVTKWTESTIASIVVHSESTIASIVVHSESTIASIVVHSENTIASIVVHSDVHSEPCCAI